MWPGKLGVALLTVAASGCGAFTRAAVDGASGGGDGVTTVDRGTNPTETGGGGSLEVSGLDASVDGATMDVAAPDGPNRAEVVNCGRIDLTCELVSYWKLDDGQGVTAVDSASAKNDGKLMGNGATWVHDGAVGGALLLDGKSGFVSLGQDLSSVLGGTATLAFWIKTTQAGDGLPNRAPAVAGIDSPGAEDLFWGTVNAEGRIGLGVGPSFPLLSNNPINDGVWHHVVITRLAEGGADVFVDGNTSSGQPGPAFPIPPFRTIGRVQDGPFLAATIDEIRIWRRLLSPDEVAEAGRR
jgi:hypothetical protein